MERLLKSGTGGSGQLYGSLLMMQSEFSEHRSTINQEHLLILCYATKRYKKLR